MAARDFESLLQVWNQCGIIRWFLIRWNQCAILVFEGLLPAPHNTIVLRLLFLCAHWHGLAKLRMHTDTTLKIMEEVTKLLGEQFRKFSTVTCEKYDTKELQREIAACARRASQRPPTAVDTNRPANKSIGREKKFNLNTYKYHSLADYPDMIRQFGTSDSYNTEIVSPSGLIL